MDSMTMMLGMQAHAGLSAASRDFVSHVATLDEGDNKKLNELIRDAQRLIAARCLMPYTVIGYFSDNGQPFSFCVWAESKEEAVTLAARDCVRINASKGDEEDARYWQDNAQLIDVIQGHPETEAITDSVCSIREYLELIEVEVPQGETNHGE